MLLLDGTTLGTLKSQQKLIWQIFSLKSCVDVDASLLGYGTASLGSYSLRQHCALPHLQGSEFFLDILTFEDQDTMSPQNAGT